LAYPSHFLALSPKNGTPRAVAPLATEDLTLVAGGRVLVRGLELEIHRCELWCVLGPNGAGKTTLIHTLAGLRRPEDGVVRVNGKSISEWRIEALARVRGLLPQSLHDSFSASVVETVLLGRHPYLSRWQWESEEDRSRALDALAAVHLEGFAERDVLTLSGGERRRVALAALLAQDPEILLLDEPIAALDLKHQSMVLRRLVELATHRNKTIVLSIHDINLAARFASHALLLSGDGSVIQGPAREVMNATHLSRIFDSPVRTIDDRGRMLFAVD
jgi:iron complex transport system ATP-binding protein